MDIYERLKADHETQKDLAAKLAETSGDTDERRELFEALRSEAEAHAAAEEQTFYAALIATPEGQEKARHSVSEHKEAADHLGELSEVDMASPAWLPKLKQLREELEHHIEEEEGEVFRLARKLWDEARAEQLASEFEDRKKSELR